MALAKQCALLGVSRSSLYYVRKGESEDSLALMRRMDQLHMDYPFFSMKLPGRASLPGPTRSG